MSCWICSSWRPTSSARSSCSPEAAPCSPRGVDGSSSTFTCRSAHRRLWAKPAVTEALANTLSLLTQDDYSFHFEPLQAPRPIQPHLEELVPTFEAEQVLLFTGDTDSLGGAIRAALLEHQRVALVSHSLTPRRPHHLDALAAVLGKRAPAGAVHHLPVWAGTAEEAGREHTPPSHDFLLAALATVIASTLGLDRICCCDNGVASFNLQAAPEPTGGRATRVTHPQVKRELEHFFSLLLERPFTLETPFLWDTQADVLRLIHQSGCADMVPLTVNCSRTSAVAPPHTHCGSCAPCVERRGAALAAGLSDADDPPGLYEVDLLTGERASADERRTVESWVQRAQAFLAPHELHFFTAFPEATRLLRYVPLSSAEAARRLTELHHRYGQEVRQVLVEGLRSHAAELLAGQLPGSCLLLLAIQAHYRAPSESAAGGQPSLRREGHYWRVWFENAYTLLKDSMGLRYLARLLQAPERYWACEELMAAEAGPQYPAPHISVSEATDMRALRRYRQRLEQLEDELAEAERLGEADTLLELKEEHQHLERYLRSVTGLRGAPRRFRDEGERARQAVSVALKRALKELEQHHPPLQHHLQRSLKLGRSCVYRPSPPVSWDTPLSPSPAVPSSSAPGPRVPGLQGPEDPSAPRRGHSR